MECAVVIVENGCIVIYKSDDRLKLEKEVMGMMKHNDCYRFKMQLLEDVETIINESGVAA